MKHKNDLYDLVQSLTKTELRHVSIALQKNRVKKTDYVRLLSAIRNQAEYNEQLIKDKFKGEKFINQFDVKKHYLYNAIIKQMQLFHYDKNKLNRTIEHIELLINKGLFKQAQRALDASLQKAKKVEELSLISGLLNLKERLSHYLPEEIDRSEIIQEMDRYQKIYQNNFAYNTLYIKIRSFAEHYTFCRTPEQLIYLNEITDHELMSDVSNALSLKSKKLFWEINYMVHGSRSQWHKAYEFANKEIELYEEATKVTGVDNEWRMTILAHLLTASIHTKQNEIGKKWLDYYEEVSRSIKDVKSSISLKFRYHYYRLIFANKFNLVGGDNDILQESESFIKSVEKRLEPARVNYFHFELAKSYYQLGEFKKAAKYNMNVLLQSELSEYSKDIYAFSAILDLILSFEIGNMDLVESQCRRTQANLKRRDILYPFEKAFLKFARTKLTTLIGAEKKKISEEFSKFKSIVDPYINDGLGMAILNYFDFEEWINSKIQ